MTWHRDDPRDPHDPLRESLARLDPAADLPPLDDARRAELLEDAMDTSHTDDPAVTRTGRGPLTWIVAAAAAAVIAGVVAVGVLDRDEDTPVAGATDQTVTPQEEATVTELTGPTAAVRCALPRAEVLAAAEVALAGTVESVEDGTVVLVPGEFYAGRPTDLVEVAAPEGGVGGLLEAVPFEEGGDYLVAANDGSVMVCGYSGEADPTLVELYAEAFNR